MQLLREHALLITPRWAILASALTSVHGTATVRCVANSWMSIAQQTAMSGVAHSKGQGEVGQEKNAPVR